MLDNATVPLGRRARHCGRWVARTSTLATLLAFITAYGLSAAQADEHFTRIVPGASCPKPVGTIHTTPRAAAEYLSQFWFERAPALRSGRPTRSTQSVLEALGQLSHKDRCIFLFEFVPGKGIHHEDPENRCGNSTAILLRVYLFKVWLIRAMRGRKQHSSVPRHTSDFHHPFFFYVDASDGHRYSAELGAALGAPILVPAKWSGDNYSIPIPDAHMVAGQLVHTGHRLNNSVAGFAAGMAPIYSPQVRLTGLRPWQERKDALAYRGCCNPTLDSRTSNPDIYVYPRADLCRYVQSSDGPEAFDVSTSLCGLKDYCDMVKGQNSPFSQFCKECGTCPPPNPNHAMLTKPQMAGYRYLADVDGYTASYDGKMWKLRSGSTVFSVLPEDAATGAALDLHQQWYFPLLHDGKHYFKTTVRSLEQKLQWCRQHEETCMQVGSAGQQLAECIVTPAMAAGYTYLVLKRIHDLAAAAAAAARITAG